MQTNITNEEMRLEDMEEIRKHVRETLSSISRIDIQELADDVNVREELGIDSLTAMEVIATVEKKLGIRIDEGLYADIETIGDFLDLITVLYRKAHG
ncbi:MAG: acyl carrier protein [Spirochaetales bacterium]|nr:acyl carrier protein [Spirochaetales bacterium]